MSNNGSYTDVFGGSTVQPTQVSYQAIALTANTTLVWPSSLIQSTNVVARINNVTANAGLALTMPAATQVSTGQDALFNNVGANSFTIKANDGTTITSVAASTIVYIYLTDNTTAAGSWNVVTFGGSTSSANAGSLAGLGLTAITTTLNQSHPVSAHNTAYTVAASDRASLLTWTAGAGTFSLTAAATLGGNFFVLISNQGSGVLTLTPNGTEQIDGAAFKSLNQQESLILVCDGSNWFSVGYGRAIASNTTRLVKSVAGNTDVTLSAVEAANVLQEYTGALTGNINVIVPTSTASYHVYNNTTGAFTLTVKTAAGTGITVPQGTRVILDCDATNVVRAATTTAGDTNVAGKLTNVTNGAARTDAPSIGQIQDGGINWVVAGGAADAITATYSPAVTALIDGQMLMFRATAANATATPTFAPNGLTAYTITKMGGAALVAGDIPGNLAEVMLRYNLANTRWELLNPYISISVGAYKVVGLTGANNSVTPNTKFDTQADEVTLRNAVNGTIITKTNTGTITNDVTVTGPAANGRDQAGAFGAGSWVHFYFIWNGTALATLSSASAPPTGPTLPTGYTYWAYIGAYYFNGSSQLVKTHIRGAWAYLDSFNTIVSAGSASTETAIGLSAVVPPNASAAQIFMHSTTSAIVGGGTDQVKVRSVSGSDFDLLQFVSNTSVAVDENKSTIIPLATAQTIYYLISRASTGGSVTADIGVNGYKMPNGGE